MISEPAITIRRLTPELLDGYLAHAGVRVVGWVDAAPRERYPQLSKLPGDGAGTGATPCFLIDPEWRGRGVAVQLLEAAVNSLRDDGMARLEATPTPGARTPAERHFGTVELFESAGYEKIAELPNGRPLMEKKL